MSKVYLEDSSLTAIADAIRAKNGQTTTYTPAEMAAAITAIEGSGSGTVVEDNYDYSALQRLNITNTTNTKYQDLSDYLDGTEKVVAINAYGYPWGYSGAARYRAGVYCYTAEGVDHFRSLSASSAIISMTDNDYMELQANNRLYSYTYYNGSNVAMRLTSLDIYYYPVKEEA